MIRGWCEQPAPLRSSKRLGGIQGMAASPLATLHPSSKTPSSHHPQQPQHYNQLHPLNLSKLASQILWAQRDPGHQVSNGDSPQAVSPLPERARHQPGCRLLFFQLPAEVSWKGLRAALNTFFWRKK